MVNAKNLIRNRLKLAISSYWTHQNEDISTQVGLASMWYQDCYGYITAMLDGHLISFYEYDFYIRINARIRDLV